MEIYRLLYISESRRGLSAADIQRIADQAKASNKKNDVTGILLFHNGYFVQFLEGEKFNVSYTYKKIRQDERHTGVKIILEGTTDQRLFGNWSMKYNDLSNVKDPDVQSKILELTQGQPDNPLQILTFLWKFLAT